MILLVTSLLFPDWTGLHPGGVAPFVVHCDDYVRPLLL